MIAISTAFKRALVGVSIGGGEDCLELDSSTKHSENLLPAIDKTISAIGKSLQDNDFFSVVIGPGSFTGIRISLALVKGFMATARDKRVIAITTNELMAYTFLKEHGASNNFITVIDALSGLYYVCQFDKEGNKIGSERLVTKEELDNLDLIKVGLAEEDASVEYKVEPSAEDLLNLSKNFLKDKKFNDISVLEPLYLRKSQAEDSLDKKNQKS